MHWLSFFIGVLVGWIVEWLIDFFYWRRRWRAGHDEDETLQARLRDAQARIDVLEGKNKKLELELEQARAAAEVKLPAADVTMAAPPLKAAEAGKRDLDLEAVIAVLKAKFPHVDLDGALARLKARMPDLDLKKAIEGLKIELPDLDIDGAFDSLKAKLPHVGAGEAGAGSRLGDMPTLVAVPPDDLVIIEGIGPKIARVLNDNDIVTFAQLAAASQERLRAILRAAGPNYQLADPTTWPEQARLAAEGAWDQLKTLQEQLTAGRQRPRPNV